MNNYKIKSKVYVVPSKASLIGYIIVNCFIVFLMIWVVVDIIKNGLEVRDTLLIILSLASMVAMRLTNFYRAHYEISPADFSFNEKELKIEFPKHERKVLFFNSSIVSLEYSDRINCLRIVGDYTFVNSKETTSLQDKEYLFYVSVAELGMFKEKLESTTGKKIFFMDRR